MKGRHRRRAKVATVGPTLMLSTTGLLVAGALTLPPIGDAADASNSSAGSQNFGGAPASPLLPFRAHARVEPLAPPLASPQPIHQQAAASRPAASGPVRELPPSLDVSPREIPRLVLAAYVNAAHLADQASAGCNVSWQDVAAIGFIESDNARSGGSANPHWDGVAKPPILGPVLNGKNGTAAIPDTDAGRLDGNTAWDRAVGPMQFLPSTWEQYRADGNHDGVYDPEQIDDSTLAAADYLCAGGGDLSKPADLRAAVFDYNHSKAYVSDVLTVAAHYEGVSPRSLGVLPNKLHLPAEHREAQPKPAGPGRPPQIAPSTSAGSSTNPSPTSSPSDSPAPPPSFWLGESGSPTASSSPTPSESQTPSTSPSHPPSPTESESSPAPSTSSAADAFARTLMMPLTRVETSTPRPRTNLVIPLLAIVADV